MPEKSTQSSYLVDRPRSNVTLTDQFGRPRNSVSSLLLTSRSERVVETRLVLLLLEVNSCVVLLVWLWQRSWLRVFLLKRLIVVSHNRLAVPRRRAACRCPSCRCRNCRYQSWTCSAVSRRTTAASQLRAVEAPLRLLVVQRWLRLRHLRRNQLRQRLPTRTRLRLLKRLRSKQRGTVAVLSSSKTQCGFGKLAIQKLPVGSSTGSFFVGIWKLEIGQRPASSPSTVALPSRSGRRYFQVWRLDPST